MTKVSPQRARGPTGSCPWPLEVARPRSGPRAILAKNRASATFGWSGPRGPRTRCRNAAPPPVPPGGAGNRRPRGLPFSFIVQMERSPANEPAGGPLRGHISLVPPHATWILRPFLKGRKGFYDLGVTACGYPPARTRPPPAHPSYGPVPIRKTSLPLQRGQHIGSSPPPASFYSPSTTAFMVAVLGMPRPGEQFLGPPVLTIREPPPGTKRSCSERDISSTSDERMSCMNMSMVLLIPRGKPWR
jgi:hypothetical protein